MPSLSRDSPPTTKNISIVAARIDSKRLCPLQPLKNGKSKDIDLVQGNGLSDLPEWLVDFTEKSQFFDLSLSGIRFQRVLRKNKNEEGKRERALKLSALDRARLVVLAVEVVADGLRRQVIHCPVCSRQEPSLLRRRAPSLWRDLFWSRGALKGPMATLLPVRRWKLTTAT